MRLAAAWTALMSCAIAVAGLAVCAVALGGGFWAWLLALPGMFFGLQLGGLSVVVMCGAAERIGLLRQAWRPAVDELIMVMVLVLVGWWVLPSQMMIGVSGFFVLMYLVRVAFQKHWQLGEPVEIRA
jgi:hypothetical protein